MVTKPSSSEPQPAQQSEGPRELPLWVWLHGCHPGGSPFSSSFLAFLGGSLGPTMCYFIQSTLSTSHALETLEFSQEQAQSNPIWSRKQGVYLAWALSPRSLLRRACRRAEGGLQNPGVRQDLKVLPTGSMRARLTRGAREAQVSLPQTCCSGESPTRH